VVQVAQVEGVVQAPQTELRSFLKVRQALLNQAQHPTVVLLVEALHFLVTLVQVELVVTQVEALVIVDLAEVAEAQVVFSQ
jgi:hypothetical protein